MNFWFEMAVNAVDVTLILSFLVQYFGYKTETSAKYWGTALIGILSFCIIAFFSWTHLYENYASSLQILVNIVFCVALLRGTDSHYGNAYHTAGGQTVRQSGCISAEPFQWDSCYVHLPDQAVVFCYYADYFAYQGKRKAKREGRYRTGNRTDAVGFGYYIDDVCGDTGTEHSDDCSVCRRYCIDTEYCRLFFVYPFGQSGKNPNRNGAARATERMPAGKRQGH